MLPIRKIVWPTDFSEPSYQALKAALAQCPVLSIREPEGE
jgi:hypothetical protein